MLDIFWVSQISFADYIHVVWGVLFHYVAYFPLKR